MARPTHITSAFPSSPPVHTKVIAVAGDTAGSISWPTRIGRAAWPQLCTSAASLAEWTPYIHSLTTIFRLRDHQSDRSTHKHCCRRQSSNPLSTYIFALMSPCSFLNFLRPTHSKKSLREKCNWDIMWIHVLHTSHCSSLQRLDLQFLMKVYFDSPVWQQPAAFSSFLAPEIAPALFCSATSFQQFPAISPTSPHWTQLKFNESKLFKINLTDPIKIRFYTIPVWFLRPHLLQPAVPLMFVPFCCEWAVQCAHH